MAAQLLMLRNQEVTDLVEHKPSFAKGPFLYILCSLVQVDYCLLKQNFPVKVGAYTDATTMHIPVFDKVLLPSTLRLRLGSLLVS